MRIQILATPQYADFGTDFVHGWNGQCPGDHLEVKLVDLQSLTALPETAERGGNPETGAGRLLNTVQITKARKLELDPQADLYLVFQAENTDLPGVDDLANLVVARVARRGIQPVVTLTEDSPLSKRQLQQAGFADTYFLSSHPKREGKDWGKIMAQTWHIPD